MQLVSKAPLLAGLLWWGAAPLVGATELPGPAFPAFQSAQEIRKACDSGLKGARQRLVQMEKAPPDSTWLPAYDDFYGWVEDVYGPVAFVGNVHPDKAVRDAAEACEVRWQDFFSTLGQNARIFRAAKQVEPADDIDREALRSITDGAEDAGVGLPAAKRAQAKKLSDRISLLSQQFEKNIRDTETKVAFTPAELVGVPEGILKAAKRDSRGRLLLGLDYPTYFPVMEKAEIEATRERMWRAKTNEGGATNLKLLGQIGKLRREYAALFGVPSYADFVLRRRMAKNTANTTRFLDEVKGAVTQSELRDIADFREAKARLTGKPLADVTVHRWDSSFYSERVRKERFSVDEELFRPYFPPQESLQFVMRIAERMFGIRYTAVPAKLWHPEAQAYAVTDAATGKPLASLMVDLYPREGKYGHAAVWSYRSGASRNDRVPQAALVVNFDRKGLTLEELDTLLHEFGHALHSNLSNTRYSMQAGTSTQLDFVEAPSQMLEDWVFDRKVLKLFEEVCPSCKPVPDELIDKGRAARDFAKGFQTARQHLYASFDLALYGPTAPEPMALWAGMEGATPLGYVKGTMFPAGFSHVAGGYAAGYYGYLWSLVVAMDLRTAFAADRLDPVVGKRYRDKVLSQGGQRPPEQLVRDFLGRETTPKAFFDDLAK